MLKDKVAIVTGASRGIGAAIAVELAKNNAFVVVNYNGSKDKAQEVLNTIEANGGKGLIYQCDISDYSKCEEFIKEVHKTCGNIDILVNNAGITKDTLMMKMSESDFDDVININLKGTFNCIKFVNRIMLKQRSGRIINISSVSGLLGNMGQANYAASKAGVIGLTKTAARELGSRGITVNAIAPGFIQTEMTDVLSDEVVSNIKNQIPLGTLGQVEDIANMVTYLASDKGRYITGQVISIDGGMHI